MYSTQNSKLSENHLLLVMHKKKSRFCVHHPACVYLSKLYCRILSEREEKLMDLEMSCQRLADNSVDKEALLDSMQSDKTALSRAIAQNKELKTQLAELQNGFVKMVSLLQRATYKVSAERYHFQTQQY